MRYKVLNVLLVCVHCVSSISVLQCAAKPIVAFDLHGVVVHYQKDKIMPYLWNYQNKCELFKGIFTFPYMQLFRLMKNDPSFEQVIDECCKENRFLHDLLTDLSAFQALDQAVVSIILDLVEHGYEVDVISNIGQTSFARLKAQYPAVFSKFAVVVASDFRDKAGVLIKKPDVRFFDEYLKRRGCSAAEVIFIDDRDKNVQAARACGFDAIAFKSADQLKNELKVRGLLN